MKKILFAAAAVVALASCATDEVISRPDNKVAIEFDNAFVDNTTRTAADITLSNLNDFGVYGSVVKGNDQALIFNNTVVSKTNGAFTYSPLQYWVEQAKYTFTAFAPFTDAQWAYAPTDNKDAYNGVLSFDNAAALGEQDLIFASAVRETPDAITAAPEKVGFTFGHLLSKVAFKYANGFTDGNTSLNVYDVKINNTAATGKVAIANGVAGAWTDMGGNYARSFGDDVADRDDALLNSASLTTEHFYVIPVERAYNITFKVDLYQAGVLLQTYEHEINTTINFEKGKSYSISAVLTPENVNPAQQLYPIEFKVDAVEDWVNAGDVAMDPKTVATAAELVAAIAKGEPVALAADIALTEALTISRDAVIDLNGHSLVADNTDAIVVDEGATLTINGDENSYVKAATNDAASANAIWVKHGNVVINGGNYYVGADNAVRNDCIYLGASAYKANAASYPSSIIINGGTFETKVFEAGQYWVLNVQDDFYRAGSTIVVNGGSFKNYDPANNLSEGPNTNFVAAGKTVEQNGDWYIVK